MLHRHLCESKISISCARNAFSTIRRFRSPQTKYPCNSPSGQAACNHAKRAVISALNVRDRAPLPSHALQQSTSRHRNHHHSEAASSRSISNRHLRRVPQQQFSNPITRRLSLRTNRTPSRKIPNRPRRHFQRPLSCSLIRNSACTGPCDNPSVRTRIRSATSISLLPRLAPKREGSHKSFFQKWPLQRISLIKNRSTQSSPSVSNPSTATSLRNELPQDLIQIRFPAPKTFGDSSTAARAPPPPKLLPIVPHESPPCSPKRQRLQQQGYESQQRRLGRRLQRHRRNHGTRSPHRETLPHPQFASASLTAADGVSQPEALAQRGAANRLAVARKPPKIPVTRCPLGPESCAEPLPTRVSRHSGDSKWTAICASPQDPQAGAPSVTTPTPTPSFRAAASKLRRLISQLPRKTKTRSRPFVS